MRYSLSEILPAGGVGRNGAFAMAQAVVTGLCLFLLYRTVIAHIGIDRFGVWSLLLAASSMARLADLSGGGQAMLRYVAIEAADGNPRNSQNIVHTVVITNIVFNIVISTIFMSFGAHIIKYAVGDAFLSEAVDLLPFIAILLVVSALASTILISFDALRRTDYKACIVSIGSILTLIAGYYLVPYLGARGFAITLIGQQILLAVCGWIILQRFIPNLGWWPSNWSYEIFHTTTSFTIKNNTIGILNALFEPIAKFALNASGGPSLVGYYELAARIVIQIRSLLLSTANPIIAVFAQVPADNNERVALMARKLVRLGLVGGYASAIISLVASPLVSFLIFGRLDINVLLIVCALAAGWGINIMSAPLYLIAIGRGRLRWNIMGQVVTSGVTIMGVVASSYQQNASIIMLYITAGLMLGAVVVAIGNMSSLGLRESLSDLCGTIIAAVLAVIISCGITAWILLKVISSN